MAISVLPLPIIGVGIPVWVMWSAHRHGVVGQAVAFTFIPLLGSLLALMGAALETMNSWG